MFSVKGRFNTWGDGYIVGENEFYCQRCGKKQRGEYFQIAKKIKTEEFSTLVYLKICKECHEKAMRKE